MSKTINQIELPVTLTNSTVSLLSLHHFFSIFISFASPLFHVQSRSAARRMHNAIFLQIHFLSQNLNFFSVFFPNFVQEVLCSFLSILIPGSYPGIIPVQNNRLFLSSVFLYFSCFCVILFPQAYFHCPILTLC